MATQWPGVPVSLGPLPTVVGRDSLPWAMMTPVARERVSHLQSFRSLGSKTIHPSTSSLSRCRRYWMSRLSSANAAVDSEHGDHPPSYRLQRGLHRKWQSSASQMRCPPGLWTKRSPASRTKCPPASQTTCPLGFRTKCPWACQTTCPPEFRARCAFALDVGDEKGMFGSVFYRVPRVWGAVSWTALPYPCVWKERGDEPAAGSVWSALGRPVARLPWAM